MKQSADRFTPDMLGKPRRGRPPKPDALTPAERARRYRARKRERATSGPPPDPLATELAKALAHGNNFRVRVLRRLMAEGSCA